MRLPRFTHAVRTSLWLIPLCVLAGVLIALGTLWLDRRSGYTLVPQSVTGTPSDAQTTLSIFATAMASLISLVLTGTLVVASSFPAAPRPATGPDADPDVIPAREPGSVVRVDRAGLVAAARRADCVLELVPVVGDFVPGGAPLFRVHRGPRWTGDVAGPSPRLRAEELARLVLVGPERVHAEDASYGLRKLVDVAERSIAQPFNDPTTTLQALHRLHDLKSIAPPDRQAPLDRQLRLLTAAVHRAYDDEEDVAAALTPDTEGIGSGADVTTAVPLESRTGADVRPGVRVPG
jgi:uncharacterized membrane protein